MPRPPYHLYLGWLTFEQRSHIAVNAFSWVRGTPRRGECSTHVLERHMPQETAPRRSRLSFTKWERPQEHRAPYRVSRPLRPTGGIFRSTRSKVSFPTTAPTNFSGAELSDGSASVTAAAASVISKVCQGLEAGAGTAIPSPASS